MAEGSKTEKATPKKRRDERKKGNAFLSRDAVAVATLLGSFLTLRALARTSVEQLERFMKFCFMVGEQSTGELQPVLRELTIEALVVLLKVVGPIVVAAAICAVAATFVQTKFLVSGESIKPKFSRISPLQGFKRLFSLRSLVEAMKGILKISILMVIIYRSLKDMFRESSKYLYTDVTASSIHLFNCVAGMILRISIAFVALAALDFFYQWWDYERQLRMSKQEIKEEFKQMEGNPQIKGKIREIQRRMAQTRMMQQVPKADVVIRNPTHFAVALRYKPDQDVAPIVLAKGQDELALRIVKTAEEHQVAVVENVPLARSLYASAELNQEIPPELYGAVAEVLVYIFHLNENKQIVK